LFYASDNPAAAVFDTPVGGPAVLPSGQTFENLKRFPKTRFKTKQSTLSAKGPAQIASFNATAQPCRPPNQSESANLSYVRKNELNMRQNGKGEDGVFDFSNKVLETLEIWFPFAYPKRG